ncbi:hypothetical protein B0H13DRAFT_2326930 [Mycena leptocephala]|nr:hypothetical protein B0H13DRAFT_2326930 [Mycena leptocephala]
MSSAPAAGDFFTQESNRRRSLPPNFCLSVGPLALAGATLWITSGVGALAGKALGTESGIGGAFYLRSSSHFALTNISLPVCQCRRVNNDARPAGALSDAKAETKAEFWYSASSRV